MLHCYHVHVGDSIPKGQETSIDGPTASPQLAAIGK